jgi:tetratricopeptide (TPR) repeat protein
MSLKLLLSLAGSFACDAINAAFPKLRWFVILGGCLFVGNRIEWIWRHSTWEYGRNVSWLDSPNDWSVLFGLIFLNIYVVLAVFATLILSGLHYYAKWNGGVNRRAMRFSLPKKAAVVYGVLGTLFLCAAPWGYSSLQVPYWLNRMVYVKDDAKRIELCNEVLRLENNIHSRNSQRALLWRARVYENQKQYALALADYDVVISNTPDPGNRRHLYYRRAYVKVALGDLRGALADYDDSYIDEVYADVGLDNREIYGRGFAYEQLGETEKAIAEYTAVIERLERVPEWTRHVNSPVPREGCVDPNLITLDELRAIRDKLLAEE